MDFSLSPEIEDYRQRVRSFVEREILPVEADRANWDEHENIGAAALERLRAKAQGRRAVVAPDAEGAGRARACRWSAWPPATRR